jgi:alkanesulfonate monooxygenase SsuD/methylene tetrahydromethanopterin reductase-like flavin-dependent oxidoreductase (luciferase family)
VNVVKFGLGLAPFDRWSSYEEMADAVAAAEDAGFDYVTRPDHIIVPEGPEQPRSGVVFPDVIPLAGFLAGRTDEHLRLLKTCWTGRRPSFSGRYATFGPSAVEPKCVQHPHVPLRIGGNGPRPERRAATLGDGWAPLTGTFAERAEAIRRIHSQAAASGRDPDRLAFVGSLSAGPPDAQSSRLAQGHHVTDRDRADGEHRRATSAGDALGQVRRARDVGFTHLGVGLSWDSAAALKERLTWFSDAVIA